MRESIISMVVSWIVIAVGGVLWLRYKKHKYKVELRDKNEEWLRDFDILREKCREQDKWLRSLGDRNA